MRCSILRLSSSSFFSPAPLLLMLPLVPPCLVSALCIPTSLGRRYFNLADSTCNFASLVLALVSKISRINVVRSRIARSSSFWRFRSCEGVRVSSNTITSASSSSAASFTSCTFPVPIYRPLLADSILWVIIPTGSIKQAFARLFNSSIEPSKSTSVLPSSTPTSNTRSYALSVSVNCSSITPPFQIFPSADQTPGSPKFLSAYKGCLSVQNNFQRSFGSIPDF